MTAAVTCFGFQVLFLFSVPLTLFSTFHGSPLTLASRAQHIPSALRRAAAPMTEGLTAAGAVPGGTRQLCPRLWGSSAVRCAQHHHSPPLSRSLVVVLLQHDGLPVGAVPGCCAPRSESRGASIPSLSLPSALHLQAPLCSRTSLESLLSPHSQQFPQSFLRTPATPRVHCFSMASLGVLSTVSVLLSLLAGGSRSRLRQLGLSAWWDQASISEECLDSQSLPQSLDPAQSEGSGTSVSLCVCRGGGWGCVPGVAHDLPQVT